MWNRVVSDGVTKSNSSSIDESFERFIVENGSCLFNCSWASSCERKLVDRCSEARELDRLNNFDCLPVVWNAGLTGVNGG